MIREIQIPFCFFISNRVQEAQEGSSSLGSTLVDTRVLQNGLKGLANLFLQNSFNILFLEIVAGGKALDPLCMLGDLLTGRDVKAFFQILGKQLDLALESGGQDRKPHDLDQANVLLFDVMLVGVRMINTQGVLLCGQIIAQNQIQLVILTTATRDGSNRIVRLIVAEGADSRLGIRILSPGAQDTIGKLGQRLYPARRCFRCGGG